jgi:2,3-dihydroxybenzoate decarboxylase
VRLAEMDRGGVELCVLSLTAPGIQVIPNTFQAIAVSRRVNDYLAEHIAKYPKRLRGSRHCRCRILKLPPKN